MYVGMCIHGDCVGSKNISLKDSTYEKLSMLKEEDESFSDVINKLTENKTPKYLEFSGVLSEDTIESVRKMKEERKESGRVEEAINKLRS